MLFSTRLCRLLICGLLFAALAAISGIYVFAQQSTTAPTAGKPVVAAANNPEFLATADEMLKEMSRITGWELKTPLKKSIRSREEIRAYVLRGMDEEKDTKERYASARTAEVLGLIPKDFNLDAFLVDLLTEQIAGLYDPKVHEFYIADWIPADEQRMVMSHELTHALEDQHFDIEPWVRAARPNDDAELARESVLEGSAMAAMLEYQLQGTGIKLKDLPEFDESIPAALAGDLSDTPMLKKAPPFIKDSLIFPYFSGLTFSLAVLKSGGYPAFAGVFARPPANTQQIMHPDVYFANRAPTPLKLELPGSVPGGGWTLLEENSLGEFGLREVLKQYLDDEGAKLVAASWDGDIYATFEEKGSKKLMFFLRLRLADREAANRFYTFYSEALEKKYADRTRVSRGPHFFSFDSDKGSVYLRCDARECIALEGGSSGIFLQWLGKLGWPLLPESPKKSNPSVIDTTILQPAPNGAIAAAL
jgi:hypothetical protein